MKKAINTSSKLFLICILIIPFTANAQKLPNVQETSLRAPAAIKIDGKPTEWNNQLQAYNKAIECYYTISNDNDKLYLTVQASDLDIATKLINAGLTFTIHNSLQKKEGDEIAVTYPFLYYDVFDNKVNGAPAIDYRGSITDWNNRLTTIAKDIRVAGIKGVKDTISIYNPEGIKAAILFNEEKALTYELAIPLKYLGLSVKEPKPFSYTIQLNGSPNYPGMDNQILAFRRTRYGGKGIRSLSIEGKNLTMTGPNADIIMSVINPSFFSGECTLAK